MGSPNIVQGFSYCINRNATDIAVNSVKEYYTTASAIRILAKGYLPNTLIVPVKLKEILNKVKKTLQITNPNYDLVIDRLHLYYDM